MVKTDSIDTFDVATACRHLPHGDALLHNLPPEAFDALAAALCHSQGQYAHLCAGLDIAAVEARDLWYWFHPDQADDTKYHDLREKARDDPPRA